MAECYNKILLKDKNIEVECGKCLNCLANKKKEKALRIVHEMNDYKFKTFITLTMDDIRAERCKSGKTEVRKETLTKYIRQLQYYDKQYLRIRDAKPLKYISCGEYGSTTDRAHYHLVLLHNTYLQFKVRQCWKLGHVEQEALKDVKGVYYVSGYTDKKVLEYYKNNYKPNKYDIDKEEREIAFLKSSRGNGLKRINEAIAKKEIDETHYYLESFNGKNKLPVYYKNKLKNAIMGVVPKYRKLADWERGIANDNRKTIMVNQNEYDRNYPKWERFINKVKEYKRSLEPVYYYEYLFEKNKDNWATKLYNLLYNEKYEELDNKERELTNYYKRKREILKINAEQKYWAKINNRAAV